MHSAVEPQNVVKAITDGSMANASSTRNGMVTISEGEHRERHLEVRLL